jgi:hypothetical protein
MRARSNLRNAVAFAVPLALALTATTFAVADEAGPGWETIRNDAGIQVSRKVVPGSPFVAFRGEGDVDAPLLAVADVLVDVPHETDWMDSVREARILRKVSDTEYVMYSHLGTPPTMSDRELVADVKVSIDADRHALTVDMHSVDDPAAPHTDYVRAVITESSFVLRANPDGRSTHVVAEIHCDPKGSIASWVVNLFQRSWGFNTLKSLRKQVARGAAPANPLLRDRLGNG